MNDTKVSEPQPQFNNNVGPQFGAGPGQSSLSANPEAEGPPPPEYQPLSGPPPAVLIQGDQESLVGGFAPPGGYGAPQQQQRHISYDTSILQHPSPIGFSPHQRDNSYGVAGAEGGSIPSHQMQSNYISSQPPAKTPMTVDPRNVNGLPTELDGLRIWSNGLCGCFGDFGTCSFCNRPVVDGKLIRRRWCRYRGSFLPMHHVRAQQDALGLPGSERTASSEGRAAVWDGLFRSLLAGHLRIPMGLAGSLEFIFSYLDYTLTSFFINP